PQLQFLTRLAEIVGARSRGEELIQILNKLGDTKDVADAISVAVLKGLGQGMHMSGHGFAKLWKDSSPGLKDSLDRMRPLFQLAVKASHDERMGQEKRIGAIELLRYGPLAEAVELQDLLEAKNSSEIQLAVVRSLALHDEPEAAEALLSAWAG